MADMICCINESVSGGIQNMPKDIFAVTRMILRNTLKRLRLKYIRTILKSHFGTMIRTMDPRVTKSIR